MHQCISPFKRDITKTPEPQNLHLCGRSLNHLLLNHVKLTKASEMPYFLLTRSSYFNFINLMDIHDVPLVTNTI